MWIKIDALEQQTKRTKQAKKGKWIERGIFMKVNFYALILSSDFYGEISSWVKSQPSISIIKGDRAVLRNFSQNHYKNTGQSLPSCICLGKQHQKVNPARYCTLYVILLEGTKRNCLICGCTGV
jgi:hypothetical protein